MDFHILLLFERRGSPVRAQALQRLAGHAHDDFALHAWQFGGRLAGPDGDAHVAGGLQRPRQRGAARPEERHAATRAGAGGVNRAAAGAGAGGVRIVPLVVQEQAV